MKKTVRPKKKKTLLGFLFFPDETEQFAFSVLMKLNTFQNDLFNYYRAASRRCAHVSSAREHLFEEGGRFLCFEITSRNVVVGTNARRAGTGVFHDVRFAPSTHKRFPRLYEMRLWKQFVNAKINTEPGSLRTLLIFNAACLYFYSKQLKVSLTIRCFA